MINRAFLLDDLLSVILPGRRKLKAKQNAELLATLQAQDKLITAYQSLCSLPAHEPRKNLLRKFDHEDFRRFIGSDERLAAWEVAYSKIEGFDLPEMTGGVNPGDQRLLFYLIEYLKPKRVLEIGTHIGASTVHASIALKQFTEISKRKMITVDIRDVNCRAHRPWQEFGAAYSPLEMITQLGVTDIVDFVTMSAVQILSRQQEGFDLIFLDGDHSAQAVYQEIPLALERLAPGGCILLHDYFPNLEPLWTETVSSKIIGPSVIPGVYLAVQMLLREGADFVVKPLGELPWKTKLGSSVTSLALLSGAG